MKKIIDKKEYLLKLPNELYLEIEKYSQKNDLSVAQAIRKAIRRLIKAK